MKCFCVHLGNLPTKTVTYLTHRLKGNSVKNDKTLSPTEFRVFADDKLNDTMM